MASFEQDFDKDFQKMQDLFAKLKREYDLFFAGSRREPPFREAKELDTLVRKWRSASITKFAIQFRLQSFLSSYSIQNEMWNKWMRQKEEGLASDPRLVAAVRRGRAVAKEVDKGRVEAEPQAEESAAPEASPQSAAKGAAGASLPRGNGAMRKLYDELISAKLTQGEVPEIAFDAFEKRLQRQREEILKKYKDSDVVFSVVSKDGKVSLKAKVVKKDSPSSE